MINSTQIIENSAEISADYRMPNTNNLDFGWCEYVSFIISVRTLVDDLDSANARFGMKFQYLNPYRFGAHQFQNPEWVDFQSAQAEALTVEGMDWPSDVNLGGQSLTYIRTIKVGYGQSVSVLFQPSFGDISNDPYYKVVSSIVLRG